MSLTAQFQNQINEISSLTKYIIQNGADSDIVLVNTILAKVYILSVGLLHMSIIHMQQIDSGKSVYKMTAVRKVADNIDRNNLIKGIKANYSQQITLSSLAIDQSLSSKIGSESYNALENAISGLYKIKKRIAKIDKNKNAKT